ncbi:uroporphyrinogen-III C-methyltransferase [Moritella sp.]|uniref:uroporphyrinogen-III C-methyltransferase n=1 Tax=Moritella sp. TaxID=78556 RepID=UPI001D4ED158|nr:uroporphyrinogen-III C-methyltransferase [Moritella sp.]MCJ8352271.1 uroporphyrinogen-III C-methyltransferase [Moritella sp.]NQZ41984.1 uroporphyrinogen-III C-methyltransferase [Moritella sp.]
MTDKKNSSQSANTKTTNNGSTATEGKPASKAGVVTGAVAILLTLGLGAGLYYHSHQQHQLQQQVLSKLQAQLQDQKDIQQSLRLQLSADKQIVASQLTKTTQQLTKIQSSEELTAAQLETVQLAIANLKMRNPNEWMLAEAEYLIRIAGRKIALEQDIDTSLALLSSASRRLTQLNDPSLLPLRKVIEQDITTLSKLPRIDHDGLALKLAIQAEEVDNLALAGFTRPEVVASETQLSSDSADWKANLTKSWKSFSDNFITIRRQDNSVDALLSPQTAWYLTENLKTQLLQAELAVHRQDQAKFKQALKTAKAWIKRYYDVNQPATKSMLTSLDSLSNVIITTTYPTKLNSAALIQTTIRDRKINALTNNTGAE